MRSAQHFLPNPMKRLLGKVYYWILGNDLFLAKRLFFYYLAGPHRLWQEANASLAHLTLLGGLKNTDSLLEIGFGNGRLAWQLTGYLKGAGSYTGLDILPREVEWCREKIGRYHRNFHFEHSDIFNRLYNPRGQMKASQYRFPWNDESFDFVVLMSVFTHMLPDEMVNYLSEIRRVLRTDGKCLATFCILRGKSKRLGSQTTTPSFRFDLGGCHTVDRKNPESVVAYEEDVVRRLYGQSKLRILEPIRYGSWTGRENLPSQQDIVLSVKPRRIP